MLPEGSSRGRWHRSGSADSSLPVQRDIPSHGLSVLQAVVVNGAETCETVVQFVADAVPDGLAGAAYTAACRRGSQMEDRPDGSECPWACAPDEVCIGSHCVRRDDTCETNYHCRPGAESCRDGQCVPAQFSRCRQDLECDEGQRCVSFSRDPSEPGYCFIPCEDADDCPFNEICRADVGDLCYFQNCGPGSDIDGEVYGPCDTGAWTGTCYPVAEGSSEGAETTGFCLEGGTVEEGGACDSQALERSPEGRARRCAPGAVCFGDPDNPLNPDDPGGREGECANLCDPRAPSCSEGRACIEFSSADDPGTPFDETLYLGFCLLSDCDLLDPEACEEEGTGCRIVGVLNTEGRCGPGGDVPPGGDCNTVADCAGAAICGNNGRSESACIGFCDPHAEESGCDPGEVCFAGEDRWAVGFCIPGANGEGEGEDEGD